MTFIGIDVGTFETKGVLVDAGGEILATARRRHGISTPRPGHVEQDPESDWWADVVAISRELMEHPRSPEVEGVGVSAIGPCVVAVDEALAPLRPAILYGVDTRATRQIAALTQRLGADAIFERSGNHLTSQSAGPKIAWIRDEEPGAAPFVFEGTYVLAAGTSTTGTATRWLADLLGITHRDDSVTFGRMLELAAESPPGARGVLVLPHFSGERTPFQDPDSRGAIVGLGLEHTQADVARAVIEGAGHGVAEALLTFERAGLPVKRVIAIGGGTLNPVLMETVSAVTGLVQNVAGSTGGSYGDAFLAAHAVGAVPQDLDAVEGWWSVERTVSPDPGRAKVLQADHEAFVALYRSLAPWNTVRRREQNEDGSA